MNLPSPPLDPSNLPEGVYIPDPPLAPTPGNTSDLALLRIELPELGTSETLATLEGVGCDVPLVGAVDDRIKAARQDFIAESHSLLYGQAIVLNSVSNRLMQKALTSGDLQTVEKLMHLALRCQDQTRKNILALDEISNPKKAATFIRQLNHLRVEQSHQPTLEGSHHAQMDTRGTREASDSYSAVETLDTLHRG